MVQNARAFYDIFIIKIKARECYFTYPFKLPEILADNQQICTLFPYFSVKNDYPIPQYELFTATFKFAVNIVCTSNNFNIFPSEDM